MRKEVRMADIAARLGVSTVTVSKALGGQKGVSEQMREKIRTLAKEMGYQPASREGEQGKSYNFGVIVAETYFGRYETFYWEFYQAIIKAAAKKNCFVLLEVLETEAERGLRTPKLIQENKADGLFVLGSVGSEYLTMLERTAEIPMVLVDFYDCRVRQDCIISNSFYGAYRMTNYLFDHGHRDIGFVGTLLTTDSITDRYLGYQKSLMEHGCEVRRDRIIPDRDLDRRCFERLALPEDGGMPTAFVCNSDLTAGRLIHSLNERGYRVPEDVSVVGYDDYLYPGLCDVPLTTYAVDMDTMSEQAVEALAGKLSGTAGCFGIHVVEGRLVERGSVAAPRSGER